MPTGSYYSRRPFENFAPGTRYLYNNEAFAIMAYLVEILTETSFEDFCQQNIFIPLGMRNTSWFLSNLTAEQIAMAYSYKNNKYIPIALATVIATIIANKIQGPKSVGS